MSVKQNLSWLFVRFFVAAVLFVAAGLKTHQLATVPILGEDLLHARWFNILTVEFEFLFGLWLVFGLLAGLTRLATIGLFSVFALVSFYKAITGEVSCGCFGVVEVPPLFTAFFDVVVTIILFKVRPGIYDDRPFTLSSLLVIAGIWLFISVPAISIIREHEFQTLDENGIVHGSGSEIVLDPEAWIGNKFPLMNYIEATELPKQGVWLVLLYNHNCSACRASVELYEKLATDFSDKENCPRIAIIEVPPFDTDVTQPNKVSPAIHGKLSRNQKWKIKTPVLILVDEGKVQNNFTNPLNTDLIKAIWGGR
jgi:hypothetical protein